MARTKAAVIEETPTEGEIEVVLVPVGEETPVAVEAPRDEGASDIARAVILGTKCQYVGAASCQQENGATNRVVWFDWIIEPFRPLPGVRGHKVARVKGVDFARRELEGFLVESPEEYLLFKKV